MSIEVMNETVWQIDAKIFSDLGMWGVAANESEHALGFVNHFR